MPNDISITINAIHSPKSLMLTLDGATIKDDNGKKVGSVNPTLGGSLRISMEGTNLENVWLVSYLDIWDAICNATGNEKFSFNKPTTDEP